MAVDGPVPALTSIYCLYTILFIIITHYIAYIPSVVLALFETKFMRELSCLEAI